MRDFHFIFGLKEQRTPFHLAHYLCLASCLETQSPERVFFHYRHKPFGPLWDRIEHRLHLRSLTQAAAGFDPSRYTATTEGRYIERNGLQYAHEADFLRLEVLREFGGVYVDMDTLFIERYPDDYFSQDCVLGEEAPVRASTGIDQPSLCNAVIFAREGSRFVGDWLDRARAVFNGEWSTHSCMLATAMWREQPAALHVVPQQAFYHFAPSRQGLRSIFELPPARLEGMLSIHLWAHLWWDAARREFSAFSADDLTEAYVQHAESTYSVIARNFL